MVVIPSCSTNDGWSKTDVYHFALKPCDESSDSLYSQYRECKYNGSKAVWGEVHDEMCTSSSLPSAPEQGHSFIQFSLTCIDKNPDDYTSSNMFALYHSLYDYLQNENIQMDGIVIKIESMSFTSFYSEEKNGSIIHVTVGVLESEFESIKKKLISYLKASYYGDVVVKDPSFANTPFTFKEEQIGGDVSKPAGSSALSTMILVVVICVIVLIIVGVVVWFVMSKQPKKNKGKKQPKIEKHDAAVEKKTKEEAEKAVKI